MRKEQPWQGQMTPCPVPGMGEDRPGGCQQQSSTGSQAAMGLLVPFSSTSCKNSSLQKCQKRPCLKIIYKISPAPCIFNEKKSIFNSRNVRFLAR